MNYITLEGDKYTVYDVSHDEDKLISLRNIIDYKCGYREHHVYTTDYFFPPTEYKMENHECTYTGEDRDYDTEVRGIYKHEYDLIIPPQLSNLITSFLNGNNTLLDYLNGNKELTKDEFKTRYQRERRKVLNKLNKELKGSSGYSTQVLLDDLTRLDNDFHKNIKLELADPIEYLDEVKKLIKMKKIASLTEQEYNELSEEYQQFIKETEEKRKKYDILTLFEPKRMRELKK